MSIREIRGKTSLVLACPGQGDRVKNSCPACFPSRFERNIYASYTPMTYSLVMVFIETPIFTRLVKELLADEEYRSLQEALCFASVGSGVAP